MNHRLLAVFAHPDDESCGPGGTLARYAGEGVEVTVVSATRGEMGAPEGSPTRGPLLAKLRTAELKAACRALGVKRGVMLDFPDSQVEQHVSPLRDAIARLIASVRPQVVLTLDAGSDAGGPDHRAVGLATTEAFQAANYGTRPGSAGSGPLKLYYWLTRPCCGETSLPEGAVVATIDASAQLEKRRAALSCHRTQSECSHGHIARLTEPDEVLERFRLAARRLETVSLLEADLFEGVTADGSARVDEMARETAQSRGHARVRF